MEEKMTSKEYYNKAIQILRDHDYPSTGMYDLARSHVIAGDEAYNKERQEAAESYRQWVQETGGR